jgi:hypothetical protein
MRDSQTVHFRVFLQTAAQTLRAGSAPDAPEGDLGRFREGFSEADVLILTIAAPRHRGFLGCPPHRLRGNTGLSGRSNLHRRGNVLWQIRGLARMAVVRGQFNNPLKLTCDG